MGDYRSSIIEEKPINLIYYNQTKHQITVNGLIVDVVCKNIRNLHSGIYPPSGLIKVVVPLCVDEEYASLVASRIC